MTTFIRKHLLWLGLILAGVALALWLLRQHDGLWYDLLFSWQDARERGEQLREAIRVQGWLAPLLYIGLQILQVVLAPVPGEVSGFIGGYLFGGWRAFLYSTIGLSIGSWLAFVIGRLLSDLVHSWLEATKIYQRFNRLVSRNNFTIPFILFILPGFPKDSLSYLLGVSRMPLTAFLFVAVVGRIPGTLLLSYQGEDLQSGNYDRLVLLLLLAAAFTLPCYLYRGRIMAWLSRLAHHRTDEQQQGLPHPPAAAGLSAGNEQPKEGGATAPDDAARTPAGQKSANSEP